MRRTSIIIVVLCVIGYIQAAGLYGAKSDVIQLNKNTFGQVLTTPYVWMVEFYAPWCGHCKNLAPEWDKAATNLKGLVRVAALNCDEEKELCGMFGIQGFPTIKVFGSEQSPNPHQKGMPWKEPKDYQGQRQAAQIARFALDQLPNYVQTVTSKSEEKFLASTLNKALLFTDKPKTSNLYKAMAVEFKDRLAVGEVRDSQKELVEKYGVTSYPTLFAIKDGENVKFEGKLAVDTLVKFLEQYAAPAKEQSSGKSSSSKPTPPPEPEELVVVTEVKDQESFENACLKRKYCAIALFDPEDASTTKYREVLDKVQDAKKKEFRVSWIDGTTHQDFVQKFELGSYGYPQILVYVPKKKTVVLHIGAFTEEGVTGFLDKVLRGKARGSFTIDNDPKF